VQTELAAAVILQVSEDEEPFVAIAKVQTIGIEVDGLGCAALRACDAVLPVLQLGRPRGSSRPQPKRLRKESGMGRVYISGRFIALSLAAALAVGAAGSDAGAQGRGAQAPPANRDDVEVVQLRPNFYVIGGAGGNIAVQVGPAGMIVVDTGTTEMSGKALEAIERLSPGKIRYIINTSADADHVGGNEVFSRAGRTILGPPGSSGGTEAAYTNGGGASILAHENVMYAMSKETNGKPLYPLAMWPSKITTMAIYPMYLNGDGIQVLNMPAAHSDGDSVVFFRRADVIVAGDVLDTTRFPVIKPGGSLQGIIDSLNHILRLTVPPWPLTFVEERTFVVPGHGFVCDYADVAEIRNNLVIIRDRVQDMIDRKMTLEQVKAANPTEGFRKQYGSDTGTWTTDMFVEAVYRGLTANPKR
jgi:cyclase